MLNLHFRNSPKSKWCTTEVPQKYMRICSLFWPSIAISAQNYYSKISPPKTFCNTQYQTVQNRF